MTNFYLKKLLAMKDHVVPVNLLTRSLSDVQGRMQGYFRSPQGFEKSPIGGQVPSRGEIDEWAKVVTLGLVYLENQGLTEPLQPRTLLVFEDGSWSKLHKVIYTGHQMPKRWVQKRGFAARHNAFILASMSKSRSKYPGDDGFYFHPPNVSGKLALTAKDVLSKAITFTHRKSDAALLSKVQGNLQRQFDN